MSTPEAAQVNVSSDLLGIKPPSFDCWHDDNLPQKFKSFRRYCELIFSTPAYSSKPNSELVKYILLWMGPQAIELFDNWTLTEEQRHNPEDVWSAFQNYFEPKSNFRLARFQLRDLVQQANESIDTYVNRLKVQAQKCNFSSTSIQEDNIIDQIIKGTHHAAIRKQLLDHDPSKLTLNKVLDFARTFEATQSQLQQFSQAQASSISAVKKHYSKPAKPKQTQHKTNLCKFCGGPYHKRDVCPASGQSCNRCHKIGHWGKVCRSTDLTKKSPKNKHDTHQKSKPQHSQKQKVSTIQHDNFSSSDDDQSFDRISFGVISKNKSNNEAYTTICIKPYKGRQANLRGKVDTGAQGNILPLRVYKDIYPKFISPQGKPTHTKPSNAKLTAYNNTPIKQYGTISIPCKYQDSHWRDTTFYITDSSGPVIFGLATCTDLELVTMNCHISEKNPDNHIPKPIKHLKDLQQLYPDRFTGLGKLPGEHKLVLNENAQPFRHPPRRAPIHLRDKIRAELDRMLDLDVIRPVVEPTDWVSSITYVQKVDGSLRICLDPKDLNDALKRGQHHIPTVEELTHKFTGSTVFSKLDAKSGYWTIQLESESQLLTTFNSPFGRFCFKRLPFGLKVSQDIFQRSMDQAFEGLEGIVSICDDITVHGINEEDHDQKLHKLFVRAREKGIVFNPSKCHIKQQEVTFFGNRYSKDGVSPDPKKIEAIVNLESPANVAQLQSFLGMLTYLAPFVPNLSEHTTELRKLLRKDSEFQWYHEHEIAFQKLKSLICQANSLAYYDPKQPAILQVDASQVALGAALVQDNRPIAYASKSLTDTEKRYANIEREMLACVFGAERFHTYLYGQSFTIESDHRPLEMICKKNLTAAPARLQRMLLRLQHYDYKIKYKPGKEMILADSLSRLPQTKIDDQEIRLDVKVCFVQFSTERLTELRDATKADTNLSILMKYIYNGFPPKQRDLHSKVKGYWHFRDELTIENGIIIKGNQVVIPTSLQPWYLEKIHDGHQGITRCQQRARSSIYWPGINESIEKYIAHCLPCQTHQSSQAKEPLMPVIPDLPNIPWHTIGTDLFTFENHEYLIIADYFSKYPIIKKLHELSSQAIANFTSEIFSMFGVPNTVISDNGPQFVGKAYQSLIQSYGICHITSSPVHPKSHGFIERMIRTVKSLFRKSPQSTNQALLNFRTTPSGSEMPSPAELLFNRKIQSNLPIHTKNSQPDSFIEKKTQLQSKSKADYDQHSHELSELDINQSIFYQDVAKKTWTPGIIIGYGPEERSYTVQCSISGRTLRRNRVLIRPRQSTVTPKLNPPNPFPLLQNPMVQPQISKNSTETLRNTSNTKGKESKPTPHPVDTPTRPPSKSDQEPRRSRRHIKAPSRLIEEA